MIPPLADLPARPRRIVVHWTAGGHTANSVDLAAYHFVVEESGMVVTGVPVAVNMRSIDSGAYAAHVRGLNSYSVGVSLAGMTGAVQFGTFGSAPITERQMHGAIDFLAECCEAWGLDPTDRTQLLTHAEVPDVYGVPQPGKWDITVLPWDSRVRGAVPVGNWIRGHVARAMESEPEPAAPVVDIEGDEPGETEHQPLADDRPKTKRLHPLERPVAEVIRPGETVKEFLLRTGVAIGQPVFRGVWDMLVRTIEKRAAEEVEKVLDRTLGDP